MSEINIDDIKVDFGEGDRFRDDNLMDLIKRAYNKEIMCRRANVKMSAIVPFIEDDEPVSEDFRKHFLKRAEEEKHIPMFLYQKGDKFIMSDDYNSYALYKEFDFEIVPSVIVGNITNVENIVTLGSPFELEAPSFEVVNKDQ